MIERKGWQALSVVPGKPEQSRIVRAVRAKLDDALKMPPSKVLPERAIADLVQWI